VPETQSGLVEIRDKNMFLSNNVLASSIPDSYSLRKTLCRRGPNNLIYVISALEKLIRHADTGAAMPEVDAQRFGPPIPAPYDRKRADCVAV
jgi:hypothetical protein